MSKENLAEDPQLAYTEVEEEDTLEISSKDDLLDTEIKDPFDPKKIDIDTKVLTIDLLLRRMKADPPEIDLYPDFQRKDDIWNKTKQSWLIESILIRLPLPAFYFDGSDDNKWLVVDGLQRLSTLRNFIIDKTLSLQKMEFLTHLNGSKFDDLPREFQRRIEETQITAYIIKPGTPQDVKFNIFNRINTGGVPLTAQEIRHALNQGIPAKYVAELANTPIFKKATDNINPDRMLDRDFVTRFISFYLIGYKNYEPELDNFLNKGMGMINDLSEEDRRKLKKIFIQTMMLAHKIFGNYAFRKQFEKNEKRKPISKALFDSWSVILANLEVHQQSKLLSTKERLVDNFISLMNEDEDFLKAISQATGSRKNVNIRFEKIKKVIKNTLND
jgi:hypothetical protein